MSGAMKRLDERAAAGVLAAAAPGRDICWTSTRPPGFTDAVQHLDVRRVVALADVLAHLEGADGVEAVAPGTSR